MGIERFLGDGILLTTVDAAVNWGRRSSLWPLVFGTACCFIEVASTIASRFDLARFGAEVMRPSPRQADLMIVAGRLSKKMAPVMRQLYDQMPNPKYVISMGSCASSGGVFKNYAIVQGVDKVVPVDVYVPGCPPRPEQLLDGFMTLQERIRKGGSLKGERDFGYEIRRNPSEKLEVKDDSVDRRGDSQLWSPTTAKKDF